MDVRTDGVAEYIARSIAGGRIDKLKEKERESGAMLQRVQLEDGILVVAEEGVLEEYVECPACSEDRISFDQFDTLIEMGLREEAYRRTGTIRVEAPYGLEAGEMASPAGPRIDASQIPPETLLWAIEKGAVTLKVNNTVLASFDQERAEEYLYHLPILGKAITPNRIDVLRRASKNAIKKWMAK